MDDVTVDYVIEAVAFVASEGWRFLPQYTVNPETGEWRHIHHTVFKERRWLGHISYASGTMSYKRTQVTKHGHHVVPTAPDTFDACLAKAAEAAAGARKYAQANTPAAGDQSSTHHPLLWFLYPAEASRHLLGTAAESSAPAAPLPFVVRGFGGGKPPSTSPSSPIKALQSAVAVDSDQQLLGLALARHCQPRENSSSGLRQLYEGALAEVAALRAEVAALETAVLEQTLPTSLPVTVDSSATNASAATASSSSPVPTPTSAPACTLRRPSRPSTAASAASTAPAPNSTTHPANGRKVRPLLRFHAPPKSIFKPAVAAMEQFEMIRPGDRVLVCVSGGKDSLSMLHLLKQYQRVCASQGWAFELGAATVDPGTAAYDPSPLKAYMQALGVPYFYEEQCIVDQAGSIADLASICSFCSRMKRGRLYACARREGYNVLALGQHLDDLCESFLMSAFHNGLLNTMKANYTVKEGDLRVIRPLVFVREAHLRAFAEREDVRLPVISENCPACFEEPKERHRVKQLLAAQELIFPRLFASLKGALLPLMAKQIGDAKGAAVEAAGGNDDNDDDDEE